jgi:hypothetical protein
MNEKKLKKNNLELSQGTNSSFLLYQTEDGKVKIETHFENETVWLTIEQIAELFQKSRFLVPTLLRGNAYGAK